MSDADVITAIRRTHLKANIDHFERDPTAMIMWERAWVDRGGTIFGPGPYLKVPVIHRCVDELVRVYAPARLRRRLAQRWVPMRRRG